MLTLSGGRLVLGLTGAAPFHCGLLVLGTWPYAVPALVLLLVTLWRTAKPLSHEEEKP